MSARVVSVNVSDRKGTAKRPVPEIALMESGVRDDAHAGRGQRQVSLLARESVERFAGTAGRAVGFGEFAENITTEGIELHRCGILDRLRIGSAELELTQVGKDCHGAACAIFHEVGSCIMPQEGVFCRVLRNGTIRPGDAIAYAPKVVRAAIVTLSDRASGGVYEDRSGPRIRELLEVFLSGWKRPYEVTNAVIPDDADALRTHLTRSRDEGVDFVFTTGGTGIGERDITVETTSALLDRQLPGIMELIRVKYGMENPNALLSRGVAGTMGKTLVFTLPGGVRAVGEYLSEITKTLEHALLMLHGIDRH
jgi:molybdopterin adenylyltransferase